MSTRKLVRWRLSKCKSLIDIDMWWVWKSLKSLSDRFYYSYFIWKESIIDIIWVFWKNNHSTPTYWPTRYVIGTRIQRTRGITVDHCVFNSMDFYQLVASSCNNICTFFILGTSWENLKGLCHEDITVLGQITW